MDIKIIEKIVDKEKIKRAEIPESVVYKKAISFCCKGSEKMFEDHVLSVQDKHMEDRLSFLERKKDDYFCGIEQMYLADYGDFSYDGEDETYMENYMEEYAYYGIKFCPYCGKKININVEKIDVTDDVEKALKMLPKGKKTKEEKIKIKKVHEKIEDILGKSIY